MTRAEIAPLVGVRRRVERRDPRRPTVLNLVQRMS
jgi:hypothetical protein